MAKVLQVHVAELDAEAGGDARAERLAGAAREDHQPLGVLAVDAGGHEPPPVAVAAAARAAARAAAFAVNPSMTLWRARAIPRAPSGTSVVMMEPAPVIASSPIRTGATNTQSEPVLTRAPIQVRCLREAVVVGGDVAGADVGVLADVGVADVRQVRHLGALAQDRVLELHVGADAGAVAEHRAGAQVGEGPDPAARRPPRTW